MIVTTGKTIKIDEGKFHFERNSETPGIVVVTEGPPQPPQYQYNFVMKDRLVLPTNETEMEAFIAAYRRVVAEDVGYRKQENE